MIVFVILKDELIGVKDEELGNLRKMEGQTVYKKVNIMCFVPRSIIILQSKRFYDRHNLRCFVCVCVPVWGGGD